MNLGIRGRCSIRKEVKGEKIEGHLLAFERFFVQRCESVRHIA
jgi:hypothetical protein